MAAGPIRCARLLLEPADRGRLEAEARGAKELARALRAEVPEEWPPVELREALPVFIETLRRRPEAIGWAAWHWIFEEGERRILAGDGGFHAPPDRAGSVEIGYTVLPAFRGRGFAVEGGAALVAWAFSHPEVRRVAAETEETNGASIRVLKKIGFFPEGEGGAPGTLRFLLERVRFFALE